MDSRQKSFFLAIAAGAGAYWLVDANESVRSSLAVLTFFIFAHFGEGEIEKDKQKAINGKLNEELRELRSKLERLER